VSGASGGSGGLEAYLVPRPEGARALPVLGTMNFGGRTPAPEALRLVARALERGVRHVDTANGYTRGESERLVGRALAQAGAAAREGVLVATKVGLDRVKGRPEGLSGAAVRAAVQGSLQRLGTGRVDLLYLHAPDPAVPPEETLDALAALVESGAVRHWGVSNFAAWQVLELVHLARARGLPPPRVSQVLYNLLVRQVEVEALPFARRYGLHTTVYNPLAAGLLTGRHAPGAEVPKGSRFDGNPLYQRRYWSERLLTLAQAYGRVASEAGVPLPALAHAWLATAPGVDSVLLGPGTLAHLDAALDAWETPVAPELRARLDAVHGEYLGTDARYAR
jgi:aryl-alcohol dehydrogenase-like predicted oxidoreductase